MSFIFKYGCTAALHQGDATGDMLKCLSGATESKHLEVNSLEVKGRNKMGFCLFLMVNKYVHNNVGQKTWRDRKMRVRQITTTNLRPHLVLNVYFVELTA